MTRVVKIRGRLGPIRLEYDAEYEDPPTPEPPKARRWQRTEVAFAWVLLAVSLAAWPATALTVARNEPQVVLGLSWLAITLVALDYLKSSRAHRDAGPGR